MDPFSMLELTLEEGSESEVQINLNKGEEEDPLNITNDTNNLNLPSLPLFGRSEAALEKVYHNFSKLAHVSEEEMKYRSYTYSNKDLVLKSRLHCTICDVHIGCKPSLILSDITHPLLKVLCCNNCTLKYRYVQFPLTPFGQDVICRWCTNPAAIHTNPLRYCSDCPFAFCEKCISKNFPTGKRCKDFWTCFVCHNRQLWPARAILSGLLNLVTERCGSNSWVNDISQCCTAAGRKRIRKTKNDSDTVTPQCSLTLVNKLTIETKSLKDQFRLVSTTLKEMLDKVNTVNEKLTDFDKADTVQKLVEDVLLHVKNSTNHITETCTDVKNELSVKLKDAIPLHVTVPPSAINHSMEDKKNHAVGLTSIGSPNEQESFRKEESLSPEINGKVSNNVQQKKSTNNNNKPSVVNTKTTENINQKSKPIETKLSNKKPPITKVQKNPSRSKTKTKNELSTTVFTEDRITEFNGIPIKKCFVQLIRIPISSETIT